MRRGLTILTLGALVMIARPAAADPTADAMKAFDDGRKLRDEGYLNAAIKEFERSRLLAPSIGANYNLGYCYEQVGNPASALAAYRRAATIAQERSDPRLADASDAIKKLLATQDHVVLKTPADVLAVTGLEVDLDGQRVDKSDLNGEVFHAGKVHTITVRAPGHSAATTKAKSGTIVVVALGATNAAGPSEVEPAAWGTQKWAGVGLAGAGVVTAAVGVVVALGYYGERDDLQRKASTDCAGMRCQRADGTLTSDGEAFQKRAEDLDSSALTRNVIVFGIAGALVAGGAVLFFTAPSSSVSVVPQVGVRDGGLSVVGTF